MGPVNSPHSSLVSWSGRIRTRRPGTQLAPGRHVSAWPAGTFRSASWTKLICIALSCQCTFNFQRIEIFLGIARAKILAIQLFSKIFSCQASHRRARPHPSLPSTKSQMQVVSPLFISICLQTIRWSNLMRKIYLFIYWNSLMFMGFWLPLFIGTTCSVSACLIIFVSREPCTFSSFFF